MKRIKITRYNSRKLSSWLLVMLIVLVSAYPGFAQSSEQPTEAQQAKFGGPDTVPNRIEAELVDKDYDGSLLSLAGGQGILHHTGYSIADQPGTQAGKRVYLGLGPASATVLLTANKVVEPYET